MCVILDDFILRNSFTFSFQMIFDKFHLLVHTEYAVFKNEIKNKRECGKKLGESTLYNN